MTMKEYAKLAQNFASIGISAQQAAETIEMLHKAVKEEIRERCRQSNEQRLGKKNITYTGAGTENENGIQKFLDQNLEPQERPMRDKLAELNSFEEVWNKDWTSISNQFDFEIKDNPFLNNKEN